ncbi:MAG TPA: prephenate dehydratase domain-containing protein [Candidatus Tyrphobacter sp.]|nr:prephenate dehydratase domain-containing protein [Candidatus Tyrphobacter sp.]
MAKVRGVVIGLQGGEGSFNEEAGRAECARKGLKNYRFEYLYTARGVFRALAEETIAIGQMAIFNSAGGVVDESIRALAENNCRFVSSFSIPIRHFLLAQPGVKIDELKEIMSHPQALAQCRKKLQKRYPAQKLVSGRGKMIDQALAAKFLASGKLPRTTAVLAPLVCAELYPLNILDKDLQDLKENVTIFVWIKP